MFSARFKIVKYPAIQPMKPPMACLQSLFSLSFPFVAVFNYYSVRIFWDNYRPSLRLFQFRTIFRQHINCVIHAGQIKSNNFCIISVSYADF